MHGGDQVAHVYDRLNNEIAPSIRGRAHFAVNDPSPSLVTYSLLITWDWVVESYKDEKNRERKIEVCGDRTCGKKRVVRGENGKMRNAKICRLQLQLHGFTVHVAAAPGAEE